MFGGKSPAVILDDYDVGTAAASLARWAPMMTGQVCSSLTRPPLTIILAPGERNAYSEAKAVEPVKPEDKAKATAKPNRTPPPVSDAALLSPCYDA